MTIHDTIAQLKALADDSRVVVVPDTKIYPLLDYIARLEEVAKAARKFRDGAYSLTIPTGDIVKYGDELGKTLAKLDEMQL